MRNRDCLEAGQAPAGWAFLGSIGSDGLETGMPEYDYQCEKCGADFVKEHPMAFNGKAKCPACGSLRTVKVFHAAGVVFKGSGFYVTDSSTSRNAASGINSNGESSTAAETAKKEDKADNKAAPLPSTNGNAPAKDNAKSSGKDKK